MLEKKISAAVKNLIIEKVGPLRHLKERLAKDKADLSAAQADLSAAHTEIVALKRQLNLIGDQHKLYTKFADALMDCYNPAGYDDAALSRYLVAKSSLFINQQADKRPIAFPDHLAHTILVALLVVQQQQSLRVIDFGGGCGIPFALLTKLCQGHVYADWRVVEVPTLTADACRSIAIPSIRFSDDLEDSVANLGAVDLVHTAGTLQYVDDPRRWLRRLLAIKAEFVFFGRTAFATGDEDIIGIQKSRIRDHGVQVELDNTPDESVEYPFTYIPERDFKTIVAEHGYDLVATFDSASGFRPINDHRIIGGGYLYRRHAQ